MKQVQVNGFLLCEVPEDFFGYYLNRFGLTGRSFKEGKGPQDYVPNIPLPPGNYSIVGLISEIAEKDLSEKDWQQISKAMSENKLSPATTLIIKKIL